MNTTSHDGNGNIVEQIIDNGDGTGTRTVYDDKGQVVSTEQLTGLPIPPPEHASDDPLAAEVSDLSAQLAAQNATIEALLNALGGTP